MKRKKITRLLALIMSSAMLILASGCGNESQQPAQNGADNAAGSEEQESAADQEGTADQAESGSELEPVTLRIFMYDKASPDDAAVAEYVNSLPQVQALNVTIEIVKQPGGGGEHKEKIPLLLATNEQMDIGFDSSPQFAERVQQGAYTDISGYLENDPEFYNAIPETYWEDMRYKGGIYAVPAYKDSLEQWVFYTDSYILEKYNIDPASIADFSDLEAVLEAEMEEGDRPPLMLNKSMWGMTLFTAMTDEYDFFNTLRYVAMDPKEGKTLINPYETEEFAELIKLMRDWNQKGYIHPDALTSENPEEDYRTGGLKSGVSLLNTGGMPYSLDESMLNKYGWTGCTTLEVTGAPIAVNCSGSVFGIYDKCENKERAYQFLKLWNTDPEVKNALYLGIPDQHYTVVDGKAQRIDNWDEVYHSRNWTTGNNMIAMLTTDQPDDYWEKYLENAKSARKKPEPGMFLKVDGISDKQAVIESVLAEYMPPLIFGFVDPETGIQQLNEQLKAAGIDEVIAELQRQYDEYLVSK